MSARRQHGTPVLEWIAAAAGLTLALGTLGFIGWEAVHGNGSPPGLEAAVERIVPTATGYVVEIEVRNRSDEAAAAVEVEGTLRQQGRTVASGRLTLDYVPGRSTRRGGMFFDRDPRSGELELRALGYVEP